MIKKGLAESGIPQPAGTLQDTLRSRFLEHYQNCYLQETRPFPSVVDTLQKLRTSGHPMAVCTNKSYETSIAILHGLALDKYFCGIIGGDTLPTAKPHPEPIEAAIGLTKGYKSSSIMVGDSITDVNAAHAAGIPVIAVSFGYTDIAPNNLGADSVIDHFDQLIPAINKISATRG